MKRVLVIFVLSVFISLLVKGQHNDSIPNVFLFRDSSGLNFSIVKDIPELQDVRNQAYSYMGINGVVVFRNGLHTKALLILYWQRYTSVSPSYQIRT